MYNCFSVTFLDFTYSILETWSDFFFNLQIKAMGSFMNRFWYWVLVMAYCAWGLKRDSERNYNNYLYKIYNPSTRELREYQDQKFAFCYAQSIDDYRFLIVQQFLVEKKMCMTSLWETTLGKVFKSNSYLVIKPGIKIGLGIIEVAGEFRHLVGSRQVQVLAYAWWNHKWSLS